MIRCVRRWPGTIAGRSYGPEVAVLGILVGLVLLTVGAELVVRGGSRLAARAGVSPLVVGLTVVAVGTSTPELAVGIGSARDGAGSLALGNVAGSNTVNILLVLGLTAVLSPIAVRTRVLRIDLPVMVGASAALLVMCLDGHLSGVEGGVLLTAAAAYTVVVVRTSRDEDPVVADEYRAEFGVATAAAATTERDRGRRIAALLGVTLAGTVVIVVGAELLVRGAVDAATALGVSDAFIGLTVVAIGTSAPELATAVVAGLRGEQDISVGNVLGSSIYNILLVLGATVVAAPGGLDVPDGVARFDLPVVLAVAVLCVPVLLTGRRVTRTEGWVFVGLYAVFLAVVLLTRT